MSKSLEVLAESLFNTWHLKEYGVNFDRFSTQPNDVKEQWIKIAAKEFARRKATPPAGGHSE